MRKNRKAIASTFFITIVIGATGLLHLMSQPRFQSIRTVDVVQMLGSGMCFGIALVGLIMLFKSRREG